MNETQKFNLHRHLIIQVLKALMKFLLKVLQNETNREKEYYIKQCQRIFKYMLKAEQSKLKPNESIGLCNAIRAVKSSLYFDSVFKENNTYNSSIISICVDLFFVRNLYTKDRDSYLEYPLDIVSNCEAVLFIFIREGRLFDEYILKYGWDRLYIVNSFLKEKGNLINI